MAYGQEAKATHIAEDVPDRWLKPAIFLASAAALYIEMVMVRWHASCFHAFAIFKNVSLLSCFLGLGIGFGTARYRRMSMTSLLPLLALQTVLFGLLSCTNLGGRNINPIAEQLIMGKQRDTLLWLHAIEGNLFLALVFVLNAWTFIPLGNLVGRLMARLERVQAYSLNLLGSLTGIAVFFVLPLLWTGPEIWLGLAVLSVVPFLRGGQGRGPVAIGSMALILLSVGLLGSGHFTFFSPYQVIALQMPEPDSDRTVPSIRVNHAYYQDILDCSERAVTHNRKRQSAANYYNLPYKLQTSPGDVVVVGSGTGNDVAAALRNGATTVTGVELDPAILMIGEHLHPERPYQNPRTRAVVNDARTFLRHTDESFDTIIYGLLDSHTNLGAMSNVRVDSFVYTLEGFREAVARLRPDGLLIVSYTLLDSRQGERLYAMLRDAYPDHQPRAFLARDAHDGGTTFVTGPGLARLPESVAGASEVTGTYREAARAADLATDDWPFFYMKERAYPFSYLLMIGVLVGLSTWLIRKHLGRLDLFEPRRATFFFLGAGFMLIETKGITELGLVFGNTWSVIAVVVGSILVMAYLANQWVFKYGPVRVERVFLYLLGSLALGWLVNRLTMAGVVLPVSTLLMPLVLTLPLFFAGLIFSSEFARCAHAGTALSANIFGAMLGGFLEYNSMYWGYSSLYPLGIVIYGFAYLTVVRQSNELPLLGAMLHRLARPFDGSLRARRQPAPRAENSLDRERLSDILSPCDPPDSSP